MHIKFFITVVLMIGVVFVGCSSADIDENETIYVNNNTKVSGKFPVLKKAQFQINEFVRNTNIEMSMLTGTNIVHSLPKYFGDAGDLYEQYTVPTIEKLYVSGLVDESFKIQEQGIAVIKVFAFYPQDIQSLERGTKLDCYIISTGNASNITRGKVFRTGLTDSRFPTEDYYAVIEGSLENVKNIEENEELKNMVPAKLIEKFKPTNLRYKDGTEHMPRVYYWKNGAKLIKKPPRNRNAEPVIILRLNTENPEIISGIKQSICEVLPLIPAEIKAISKDTGIELKINLPLGYQIEPYSFSEQLKQRVLTVSNPRSSLIIYDKQGGEILFLGQVPLITKQFDSKMIIQEGAKSAPYVVIPKFKTETITTFNPHTGEPNTVEVKTPIIELVMTVEENKSKKYIIESRESLDFINVLHEKFGYGVLEILNFFKQAISQKALDCEIIERSMYFVYNQDKTVKFYPQNNLVSFGNTILDVKLKYEKLADDKSTEINETETRIDFDLQNTNTDKLMELAVTLASVDNSEFYTVDKSGNQEKYRIFLSYEVFNSISDARIEQILNSDNSTTQRYFDLLNEIIKQARLTARIEMQVGKLSDEKPQTQTMSPNENNERTIRISKYFIRKAVQMLESANLSELEKEMLFENHRNDIMDTSLVVPQVPMRIFAIIKEEKYGLKDYPFFADYLKTIDVEPEEWQRIIRERLEYIQKSVETDELKETDKKKAIIREIEAHRKIPFFDNYVQTLRKRFAKYLK